MLNIINTELGGIYGVYVTTASTPVPAPQNESLEYFNIKLYIYVPNLTASQVEAMLLDYVGPLVSLRVNELEVCHTGTLTCTFTVNAALYPVVTPVNGVIE